MARMWCYFLQRGYPSVIGFRDGRIALEVGRTVAGSFYKWELRARRLGESGVIVHLCGSMYDRYHLERLMYADGFPVGKDSPAERLMKALERAGYAELRLVKG